ncbi:MAG: UDP-N-acetylmuramoyl-L-alanine--D-glutamate ligase [Corynebacterium sp.]|nr:UDP-N-acetylmuramoyl-L-alanine--D-glutamate ligase [Corynebacterium sp.]
MSTLQPAVSPTLPAELNGHILVTGAGVSGLGITRLLIACGVKPTLCDSRLATLEAAALSLGVATVLQDDVDVASYDLIITSPGWGPSSPLLAAAASAGIPIIGEVELAYLLDQAAVFGPKRTWVAITGTNGKTTTTSMAAHVAITAGLAARAVGNIGIPIADALLSPERIDVLVAEFSSFQLHWTQSFIPDIGVLLNIAEDHLDWHGGYAGYAAAKAKVLKAPIAIYGNDDQGVQDALAAHALGPETQGIGFSLRAPHGCDYGLVDGYLTQGDERICLRAGIEPAGDAGSYDALAAAAVARGLGISNANIDAGLHSFCVARHRGEIVGIYGDITVIDNSKATNPHAALAALRGLSQVTWVVGGQLKGADITELIDAVAAQLAHVVILGADRDMIAAALDAHAPDVAYTVVTESDPHAAMDAVAAAAVAHTTAGGQIVLAPAAASLDMYTGMAQRGDVFAAAIEQAYKERA